MIRPGTLRARVGFDAIRALSNRSGLGNYARSLLSSLHLAAPELTALLYSPREPLEEFQAVLTQPNTHLRLPPAYLQRSPLRQYWRTFSLGAQALADRVDLYHGLTQEIPRDIGRRRIPAVVTSADLLYLTHPGLFPALDRHSYRWRYGWSLRQANAVVAISTWTASQVQQYYQVDPAGIVVIPPVRDLRYSQPLVETERQRVLEHYSLPESFLIMVGTLEPRKNQMLAVQALAQLPRDCPPLLLVGRSGGSEQQLRDEIAGLGLSGRVLIRTQVRKEDLPALVQAATLALYLSGAEGFGMPIVEAMSAGVPVIAARGPHLRDAGGEAACYVSTDDPVELTETLLRLLTDSAEREHIASLGREHASRFDPLPLANQLLSVYDAVLNNEPLTASGAPSHLQENDR